MCRICNNYDCLGEYTHMLTGPQLTANQKEILYRISKMEPKESEPVIELTSEQKRIRVLLSQIEVNIKKIKDIINPNQNDVL